MNFLYPEVLWFIIIIAVISGYLWLGEKQGRLSEFSKEVYEKLTQNQSGLLVQWRILLFASAMILMVIALARPVTDEQKIKINETAIDVIAALDISRSMEAQDLYPNRLLWGKKKLLDLIEKGDDLRLGVMAFAANAYVVSPITSDEEVASYLVENLDTASISEKGTDILQLVDAAAKQLKDRTHKYLLLITDGGDEADYSDAIARAKEENIVVFVLATATEKGAPIEDDAGGFVKHKGEILLTRLNETIKAMALQTGGVFIQSSASGQDIDAMLSEIKKIATNETIASSTIKKYRELFIYFLMAALVVLLLSFSSLPKRVGASVFIASFLFLPKASQADILDFMTIDKAMSAYNKKDFNQSSQAYETLVKNSPSDEAHYNLGNSYYKQGQYKEAIGEYEKAVSDVSLKQRALHNIGNAHAQTKAYEKAKEAYEKALEISEDKQTRENLEEVMKRLKENKDNQKNDSDKDNKQKEDQDSQQKQQDQKDSKKDASQKKQSQKEQDDSEGSKEKQKQQQQQDAQGNDKESKKQKKAQEEKEGQEPQEDQNKESEKVKQQVTASQKDITDKEEHKLLKMLNQQKGQSYRYLVPTEHKKDQNDKPW